LDGDLEVVDNCAFPLTAFEAASFFTSDLYKKSQFIELTIKKKIQTQLHQRQADVERMSELSWE
jgi:hypothetical protein